MNFFPEVWLDLERLYFPILRFFIFLNILQLDGFYYAVASYSQNPSLANTCYRFRFIPRSENVTDVTMRYKSAFLGLPGQTDYFIQGTATNGSYSMNQSKYTSCIFLEIWVWLIIGIFLLKISLSTFTSDKCMFLELWTTWPSFTLAKKMPF